MSVDKNEIANELYNAGTITLAAAVISFGTRKVLKYDLGIPMRPEGMLKVAVAFGTGSLLIQYLQRKKFIPDEPFKLN